MKEHRTFILRTNENKPVKEGNESKVAIRTCSELIMLLFMLHLLSFLLYVTHLFLHGVLSVVNFRYNVFLKCYASVHLYIYIAELKSFLDFPNENYCSSADHQRQKIYKNIIHGFENV